MVTLDAEKAFDRHVTPIEIFHIALLDMKLDSWKERGKVYLTDLLDGGKLAPYSELTHKYGSKYSEELPVTRRPPDIKEDTGFADWIRKTADRCWNSVIPGRPILSRVIVAGIFFLLIALLLGLWLFFCVYFSLKLDGYLSSMTECNGISYKLKPEYLKVQKELLEGKRIFRSDLLTEEFSKMLHRPDLKKQQVIKKKIGIEEGGDEKDQSRHPVLSRMMAASEYRVENELAKEASRSKSADAEGRKDMTSIKAEKEKEEKAMNTYVAKMKELKYQKFKTKKPVIKKNKNIIVKKVKNIKLKRRK
ncbi:uncharacterized protein LOC142652559 [Rhinoderma darwinii]|uniref:uncharacterized protein LOC142652559 n=1 Tax=Rhinoderma darwinii TaxID=43563 RepID=UPI003F680F11